jgi:hypothetical protein
MEIEIIINIFKLPSKRVKKIVGKYMERGEIADRLAA